jgi:ATP-dependent DNA helicase RecG
MNFNSLLAQEIQRGESKTLEFKRELPKGDQLAKTLVAFANGSGGKLVIFSTLSFCGMKACRQQRLKK